MARRWLSLLHVQVLVAIAVGVMLGAIWPGARAAMKPLGDGFIKLIKMITAPVVFCTVVHGIASMRDGRRVGLKATRHFEVVWTFALAIGLIVAKLFQTGSGFNIDVTQLDANAVSGFTQKAQSDGVVAHVMAIIPDTFVGAFAQGELLQVLLLAVLVGINKFMSECRALTNLVGNGVACVAVSKWKGELDSAQLQAELARGPQAHDLDEVVPLGRPAE